MKEEVILEKSISVWEKEASTREKTVEKKALAREKMV